jgi:predicted HTH domain antitoxin
MGTITFKLGEEELEFLNWYSKRTSTPVGSLYRSITIDQFRQWKLKQLIEAYKTGEIGFKRMCDLGGITLTQGMLILQQQNIDPPVPEALDDYTLAVALDLVKTNAINIWKSDIKAKRESKEYTK